MPAVPAIAGLSGLGAALALAGMLSAVTAQAAPSELDCGGTLEGEVWQLWNAKALPLIRDNLLRDGLKLKGDVYALYDTQAYVHNLVSMASRCGRTQELAGIAAVLATSFDGLEQKDGQPAWVCRGGRVCTAASGLQHKEIVLTNSQFLAVLGQLASALAPVAKPGSSEAGFVDKVAGLLVSHLDRWSAPSILHLDERLGATAATVKDASSRWFFNDTDLWILSMHAELAGIVQARPDLRLLLATRGAVQRRAALLGLLQLTRERITLTPGTTADQGRAEVDRGFWRLYPDSRYAGYKLDEPPVVCGVGTAPPVVKVPVASVPVVDTVGWDISHARRLVHFADAMDRQRQALIRQFDVPESVFPPPGLAAAFARQLAGKIWNGNVKRPQFANYWDGTAGWYRVAHDPGNGRCQPGYSPYGLSDAFATGGFAVWAVHVPVLGEIAAQLYRMAATPAADDAVFLKAYYPGLEASASASTRTLTQLMFWPTLVRPVTPH
jgi:hypothetical protein